MLTKHIHVATNDPATPATELVVFGKVNAYIQVTPNIVRLMGKPGEDLRASVRLLAQDGFPFTIKQVTAKEGKDIKFEIKPLDKKPNGQNAGFILDVSNTLSEPGIIRDVITIETDLKEKSKITIPVSGRIFAPNQPGTGAASGTKKQ